MTASSSLSSAEQAINPDTQLYVGFCADPVGLHHLALMAWILENCSTLSGVTCLISNGKHPDPTKQGAIATPENRLGWCKTLFASLDHSIHPLASAPDYHSFSLEPTQITIDDWEFSQPHGVTIAMHIKRLQLKSSGKRLNWLMGADLVKRMSNPQIFSDEDLTLFAETLHCHVIERDGYLPEASVEELKQKRGITLKANYYPLDQGPTWLQYYAPLSSTYIRNAIASGDHISGMVSSVLTKQVLDSGSYPDSSQDWSEEVYNTPSGWWARCDLLRRSIQKNASNVAEILLSRSLQIQPYTLSTVECTGGGEIGSALVSQPNASRFMKQGHITYDAASKKKLWDQVDFIDEGSTLSAVSQENAEGLALGMQKLASTDFVLTESGMAGPPSNLRRSQKQGQCWIALAYPDGVKSKEVNLKPFLTRLEHQLNFANEALMFFEAHLKETF